MLNFLYHNGENNSERTAMINTCYLLFLLVKRLDLS
jgi:hypothetical protein